MFNGISDPHLYLQTTLGLGKSELYVILGTVGLLGVYDLFSLKTDVIDWITKRCLVVRWTIYILLVILIICRIPTNGGAEFIYFQF